MVFTEQGVAMIATILKLKTNIAVMDANCTVLIPCTPAWYPEQHKIIDEENFFSFLFIFFIS